MIYKATVTHYEEWDNKIKVCFMFICADTIVQAVQKISNYYGEECLEDITIIPFSPDDFVMLDDDTYRELFDDFALHAGDNVCW